MVDIVDSLPCEQPEPRLRLLGRRALVVEGKDEKHLFEELVTQAHIADVQVLAYKGSGQLRGYAEALVRDPMFPDLTHLVVHRDAETDANAAYNAVRDALRD